MSAYLYGQRIDFGGYAKFLQQITLMAQQRQSAGIAFMNSHMVYEARHDNVYQRKLKKFSLILPDGMPLVYSLRVLRRVRTERIAGNDMIYSVLELSQQHKWRVTFYGGSKHLLSLIQMEIKKNYPEVTAQLISPPFRMLSRSEDQAYVEQIRRFGPELVLVGLGCPKQEHWIADHLDVIPAPMLGVGGAFSLLAKLDSRAPLWQRRLGLEWLYRLVKEPKRLWKRYLVTNSYFILLLLREFWRVRIRKK